MQHADRMVSEHAAWRWQLLRDALAMLAAEPDEQIRCIDEAHPDEIALSFDDAYRFLPTLAADGLHPPNDTRARLDAIHKALTAMTSDHNPALWTYEAIRTSQRWTHLRGLARQAIAELPLTP